jgi:hypothetical protein
LSTQVCVCLRRCSPVVLRVWLAPVGLVGCGVGAGLGAAVVHSPSRVHPDDRDVLTPFKMVEAAKEGVEPMAWAGTPPPVWASSRRNAVM